MIVSLMMRRALTAAALAAAGAAGSYLMRRVIQRQRWSQRTRDEWLDETRWEGEGGRPPELLSAAPHEPISVR